MKVVTLPLASLRKPEKNVRIHTAKQIQEYIRSLEMFGQIRPLVVDEAGQIIVGNGMYEALTRMEKTDAECVVVSGLSDTQKKKLMLADNKVFELGLTDTEAFEDILKDIADFDIPGYDSSMLEMLSMSFAEVDDYISEYGTFEAEEVEKIASRPPETHTEGVATGLPAYSAPEHISKPIQDTATDGTRLNGQEATPRYIVCPKCGERIPIGGV